MRVVTFRAQWHGLAAEWLDRAGEGNWLVLAEHLARCGDAWRIVAWLGALRERVGALRIAPLLAETASRLLPLVDETGDVVLRVTARAYVATMAADAGMFEHADEHLHVAESLCGEDEPCRAAILLARGLTDSARGELSRAREALDAARSWSLLDRHDRYRLECASAYAVGVGGDKERALDHLERARALAHRDDVSASVRHAKIQSIILFHSGDLPWALEAHRAALRLAREAGLAYEEAIALHNIADTLLRLGDIERAEAAFRQSTALAEEHSFGRIVKFNRPYLAFIQAGEQVAQAIETLREIIAEPDAESSVVLDGQFFLAKLVMRAGDRERALEQWQRVLALARGQGDSSYERIASEEIEGLAQGGSGLAESWSDG